MNSMQSCDSGIHLMQFDNAPINLLVLPICLCLCFCLCIWSPAEAGDSVLVYNVSLYSYLINQSWSLSSFLAWNFQFVEASMAQGIIVSAPADCNWEEISNNTLRTHQDNNDDEKERIVSDYDYSPILYFISLFHYFFVKHKELSIWRNHSTSLHAVHILFPHEKVEVSKILIRDGCQKMQ